MWVLALPCGAFPRVALRRVRTRDSEYRKCRNPEYFALMKYLCSWTWHRAGSMLLAPRSRRKKPMHAISAGHSKPILPSTWRLPGRSKPPKALAQNASQATEQSSCSRWMPRFTLICRHPYMGQHPVRPDVWPPLSERLHVFAYIAAVAHRRLRDTQIHARKAGKHVHAHATAAGRAEATARRTPRR